MIQDIYPHIYRNEYRPHDPGADDVVFSYSEEGLLAKEDGTFFRYGDTGPAYLYTYLFTIDQTSFFLADLPVSEGCVIPVRSFRTYKPKHLGFAAVTGWQLWKWYRSSRYCGVCGTRMEQDLKERAMYCPSCGEKVYPKIMPAVIVGVLYEDKILVTKYAGRTYAHYALIAGFAEIGETIEETVRREVKEEAGLDVTDIVYYKSQPWSFSSTLLFGFFCRALSPEIKLDETELKEARWASRDEEIAGADGTSLTSEMMRCFLKGNIKL